MLLKDVKVKAISLIGKDHSPANGKKIVFKSEEIEEVKQVIFTKFNDELKMAYGLATVADEKDSQGDIITAEEVRKELEFFAKSGNHKNIDMNHDLKQIDDVYVSEMWIVRKGDELFPDNINSFAVGIKIENDEIWKDRENIHGLSIYGTGVRVEETKKAEDGKIDKLISKMNSIFTANKKPDMTEFKETVAEMLQKSEHEAKETVQNIAKAVSGLAESVKKQQSQIETLVKNYTKGESGQNTITATDDTKDYVYYLQKGE